MGANLSRVVSSEVISVTAQNGEAHFNIHKEALTSQSEPFRRALGGSWLESAEKSINLNDWDSETVARLVEFLYHGTYESPDPVRASTQSAAAGRQQRVLRAPRAKREQGVVVSSVNRPLTPLDECLDGMLPVDRDDTADWDKLQGFHPDDDYTAALLAHAKVYSLAQYKAVDSLRTLALRRIHLILQRLNPLTADAPATVTGVVELLGFVYANTDSLVSSEEPLRKLVSQFAALNIQALQSRKEMTELMGDGGDFVAELMPKVCRRLIPNPAPSPSAEPTPTPAPFTPPSIGNFNTGEVHHWREAWPRTSRIRPYPHSFPHPPSIPVGINTMDIGNNANIRLRAYPSQINRDRFTINMDSWLETRVWSAGCAWLLIPPDDPHFQCGVYSTDQDRHGHQTRTSRVINFPRPYAAPPVVVVMLQMIDVHRHKNWRVRTYTSNVTATGFTIHVDTWDDTILHAAGATWVAYTTGLRGVASGRFSTQEVRPLHPPVTRTVGNVGFPRDVFRSVPHALLAFDEIDVDSRRNMRLRVDYDGMTRNGMNWSIAGWGNTVVYSAGAVYIALETE